MSAHMLVMLLSVVMSALAAELMVIFAVSGCRIEVEAQVMAALMMAILLVMVMSALLSGRMVVV